MEQGQGIVEAPHKFIFVFVISRGNNLDKFNDNKRNKTNTKNKEALIGKVKTTGGT